MYSDLLISLWPPRCRCFLTSLIVLPKTQSLKNLYNRSVRKLVAVLRRLVLCSLYSFNHRVCRNRPPRWILRKIKSSRRVCVSDICIEQRIIFIMQAGYQFDLWIYFSSLYWAVLDTRGIGRTPRVCWLDSEDSLRKYNCTCPSHPNVGFSRSYSLRMLQFLLDLAIYTLRSVKVYT